MEEAYSSYQFVFFQKKKRGRPKKENPPLELPQNNQKGEKNCSLKTLHEDKVITSFEFSVAKQYYQDHKRYLQDVEIPRMRRVNYNMEGSSSFYLSDKRQRLINHRWLMSTRYLKQKSEASFNAVMEWLWDEEVLTFKKFNISYFIKGLKLLKHYYKFHPANTLSEKNPLVRI